MAMPHKRPRLHDGGDDSGDEGRASSSSGTQAPVNGHQHNGNGKQARKQRRTFANAPGAVAAAALGSSSSPSSPTTPPSDPRMLEARNRLPISTAREALVDAIKRNETVIVLADTGSGKSTQIPQYLHAAGFTSPPNASRRRLIGVTQPRRMAATALAKRVGHEIRSCSSSPGDVPSSLVEYAIRFQDRTTHQTRIKFMTDGWLLREVIAASATLLREGIDLEDVQDANHPALLPQYTVLVIDEAHERSVRSDLVLGLAKRIQARRRQLRRQWDESRGPAPELLRLVIMSATLDAELFSEFFAKEVGEMEGGETEGGDTEGGDTEGGETEGGETEGGETEGGDTEGGDTEGGDTEGEGQGSAAVDQAALDPIDAALAETRAPSPSSSPSHSPRLVPAPVLYVKGRTHPVALHHLIEPVSDWIDAAKRQILQLHVSRALGSGGSTGTGGDILVFGTGSEEIEALAASLRSLSEQLPAWAAARERSTGKQTAIGKLLVVPLYAALGAKAVAEVFKPTPPGHRKVVIATNIAETSVTIPGVRYVVDCGLAKERMHISHGGLSGKGSSGSGTAQAPSSSSASSSAQASAVGIDTLTTRPISQSAAAQRAGRAGREAPGECYRLYPRAEYDALERTPLPEIHRTELTALALDTFAAGVDPREVEWVDPPDEGRLGAAVLELAAMGAVEAGTSASEGPLQNGSGGSLTHTHTHTHTHTQGADGPLRLTPLGRKMSLLPLPPRFALMLITASQQDDSSSSSSSQRVVRQARDLVAILSSERGVFLEPSFASVSGGRGGATSAMDAAERLEEKRAEAERAKGVFRHASGDHVTLLRAFHAYRAAARRCLETRGHGHANGHSNSNGNAHAHAHGNGNGNGSNGNGHVSGKGRGTARRTHRNAEAERALRSWCTNHWVSLRSMREIEEIRAQLDGICRRAGIIRGDDEGGEDTVEVGGVAGAVRPKRRVRDKRSGSGSGSGSGSSSPASAEEGDSSDADADSDSDSDSDSEQDSASDSDSDPELTVTRRVHASASLDADAELGLAPNEDYAPLLRCLLAGRSTTNLAVASGASAASTRGAAGAAAPGTGTGTGTGTYRRLCGPEEFKLHPTSALHGRYRGGGGAGAGPSGRAAASSSSSSSSSSSAAAAPPRLVLFEELVYTTQLYVRCASEVQAEWLVPGGG